MRPRATGGHLMTSERLELWSVLRCPTCGYEEPLRMPMRGRVLRYACGQCDAEFAPEGTACCVFCGYGSVPCPRKQRIAAPR